jgi:uncharacterized protein
MFHIGRRAGRLICRAIKGGDMQLSDFREIKADPATVWAAILNPDVLKECVPGCESMSGSVADGFEAVVTQKVGPVKATFKGAVSFSDIVEGKQPEDFRRRQGRPRRLRQGRRGGDAGTHRGRHETEL